MSRFALAAAAVVLVFASPAVSSAPAQTYRCVDAAGHAAHYKLGASEVRFWRAAIKRWSDNWCEEAGASCQGAENGISASGEDWELRLTGAALAVSTDAADEALTCTAIEGDPA